MFLFSFHRLHIRPSWEWFHTLTSCLTSQPFFKPMQHDVCSHHSTDGAFPKSSVTSHGYIQRLYRCPNVALLLVCSAIFELPEGCVPLLSVELWTCPSSYYTPGIQQAWEWERWCVHTQMAWKTVNNVEMLEEETIFFFTLCLESDTDN